MGRANQLPLRPDGQGACTEWYVGRCGRLGGRNSDGAPPPPRRPVGPLREMGSDFLPWLRKTPGAGESGAGRRELFPGSLPYAHCFPLPGRALFPKTLMKRGF